MHSKHYPRNRADGDFQDSVYGARRQQVPAAGSDLRAPLSRLDPDAVAVNAGGPPDSRGHHGQPLRARPRVRPGDGGVHPTGGSATSPKAVRVLTEVALVLVMIIDPGFGVRY